MEEMNRDGFVRAVSAANTNVEHRDSEHTNGRVDEAIAEAASILEEASRLARSAPFRVHTSRPDDVSIVVYGTPEEREHRVRVLQTASSARFDATPLPHDAALAGGRLLVRNGDAAEVGIAIEAGMSVEALARRVNDATLGLRAVVMKDSRSATLSVTTLHTRRTERTQLELTVRQQGQGTALRLGRVRRGRPAEVEIDGVTHRSETNTFDGVIPGCELRVQHASGTEVEVRIERDRGMMMTHLRELRPVLAQLDGFDPQAASALRAAAEELRSQRDRAVAALEDCGVALIVADVRGRVTYVNPGYCELLDVRADDVLGAPCEWLVDATGGGTASHERDRLLERGGRWLRAVTRPLTVEGRIAGTVTACVDVTDLHERARDRREVVGLVTHEFRTPLTSLRGFAELLLKRSYPEEKQREFLTIIRNEAARLSDLVNDFLDLERLEHDGRALSCEAIDLTRLVDSVSGHLGAASNSHVLVFDLDPRAPLAWAEERGAAQILTNLVSNAVKYSAEGSEIIVRVVPFGPDVALEVCDEGVGIPPDALDRVFERFYRVPGSEASAVGSGLGLAVVRRLAERMDARVDVESMPGQGSTFRVIFEACDERRAA